MSVIAVELGARRLRTLYFSSRRACSKGDLLLKEHRKSPYRNGTGFLLGYCGIGNQIFRISSSISFLIFQSLGERST